MRARVASAPHRNSRLWADAADAPHRMPIEDTIASRSIRERPSRRFFMSRIGTNFHANAAALRGFDMPRGNA